MDEVLCSNVSANVMIAESSSRRGNANERQFVKFEEQRLKKGN